MEGVGYLEELERGEEKKGARAKRKGQEEARRVEATEGQRREGKEQEIREKGIVEGVEDGQGEGRGWLTGVERVGARAKQEKRGRTASSAIRPESRKRPSQLNEIREANS